MSKGALSSEPYHKAGKLSHASGLDSQMVSFFICQNTLQYAKNTIEEYRL